MWQGIRESLAGRFFDFIIRPLDFEECLDFKEVPIDRHREKIFEKDLKKHMSLFLKTGGFIEALELDKALLITLDTETIFKNNSFFVEAIP